MAQKPLYLLQAVDVRRASQPGDSRAVTISKLALPSIKFKNTKHDAGGGNGDVNFLQPRIEAPEPKFDAKGIDASIFAGMGQVDKWTFACAYKDTKTGRSVPARAIIEGAVAEWEPDESDPAEFQGCSHVFQEVTHYEFKLDDNELWYWDWWERVTRVDGEDSFAEIRQALGA